MHLGNRHLLRRADAAIRALPTRRTSGPGARGDARPADADLCRRLCRARAGGGVSVHALSLRPRRTRSPPRPDGRERGSRGRAARLTEPADVQVSAFPKRSEEHTSELQSLMRISYAVFCLKKKKKAS